MSYMKPFAERTPDTQYRDVLARILKEGREMNPIHGEPAKMIAGVQMKWDLRNGFPLVTERDLSKLMNGALGEHFAFLHGAQTLEEMTKWGCKWWSKWVTPEKCAIFGLPPGDLGPGSYGPAWAAFPTAEGKPFNQIVEVMKQLKEKPFLRTHIITPWIPQYTIQHSELKRKVVVAPCHGYLHIFAFPETKELVVHHFQRSGDMPVGVPFNIIQYAAFTMMAAQTIGYTPRELVYTISDAHIYSSQYSYVEELLKREPRKFPTVEINRPDITDILDFRQEHFTLTDYEPHPAMTIPTPV
jgi:thymidylate synthase